MFHKTQSEIMRHWHIGLDSINQSDISIDSKLDSINNTESNLELKPLCSFLCVTYNHAPYIEQCLQGFLEQETTFPFEIIIHDDCSTDGTTEIIREYEKAYPLIIKALYEEENQYSKGANGTPFWANMHKMAAKYIAICEGDDYWDDKEKIQKQVSFLESNLGFVGCYHECIIPDSNGNATLYDNLHNDKIEKGIRLQKREIFMSLRTLCYRNVIDYTTPLLSHYVKCIFNGDVFVNALLGGYGDVKFMADIKPAYYRLHVGGVYSSLDSEDRMANALRSLYYIASCHERLGNKFVSSIWIKEIMRELIISPNITLNANDTNTIIKLLFLHHKGRVPFKLALNMMFPQLYHGVRKIRESIRSFRKSLALKTDIDTIYYYEFLQQRIPKSFNTFFARKVQRFKHKRFNKHRIAALNRNIECFLSKGIMGIKKHEDKNAIPNLIISLTSYPKRIHQVYYTIYSLLTQSHKPDKLVLWLSKDEFPNMEDDLPNSLLRFRRYGLDIAWCEGNIKSYKKIFYTLQEFEDSIIAIADDDVLYPSNWLEGLFNAYKSNPNSIHCYKASYASLDSNGVLRPYLQWQDVSKKDTDITESFMYLAHGIGGVLYPPHSLYKDVLDSSKFIDLAPLGDDLWLWAMAVLNGTRINPLPYQYREMFITDWSSQDSALWRTNCDNSYNEVQFNNILRAYPEIIEILKESIILDNTGGGGGNPL